MNIGESVYLKSSLCYLNCFLQIQLLLIYYNTKQAKHNKKVNHTFLFLNTNNYFLFSCFKTNEVYYILLKTKFLKWLTLLVSLFKVNT